VTTQRRSKAAGPVKPKHRQASNAIKPIKRLKDVPEAMTQEEAANFYATHTFTAEALAAMPDVSCEFASGISRTRPISIRLPEWMLAELKACAANKGVAYQALVKVWLDERLREERRATRPA
jgi:predicted DNA binding CopG/RHH family protein